MPKTSTRNNAATAAINNTAKKAAPVVISLGTYLYPDQHRMLNELAKAHATNKTHIVQAAIVYLYNATIGKDK